MAKIAVFCSKGSTGKTPIAVNITYDRGYNIATNEPYNVLDDIFPDEQAMTLGLNQEFPIFPKEMDIVFDLAGAMSDSAKSIPSALKQSDIVIVPINNEFKAIKAGIHSILEIQKYNKNILVVATKLTRQRAEKIFKDWSYSKDFLEIQEAVHKLVDDSIKVLPLKLSTVFDTIFDLELSINQICETHPLLRHSFTHVRDQFEDIYKHIDKSI